MTTLVLGCELETEQLPARATDRDAWLAQRSQGIGGSEVLAVLGQDDYKSRLELFVEKRDGESLQDVGEAADWGNVFERPVIETWAKRTGRKPANAGGLAFRSKSFPHMLCTVDDLECFSLSSQSALGLIEVKTFDETVQRDWPTNDSDPVPVKVTAQVQHSLEVLQLSTAAVVWLPLKRRVLGSRDMPRDSDLGEALGLAVERFWARVAENRPPIPDGSESATRALVAMYPEDDQAAVELPESFQEVAKRWAELDAKMKALDVERSAIKNMFRFILGRKRFALAPDAGYYVNSWGVAGVEAEPCEECGHDPSRKAYRQARIFPYPSKGPTLQRLQDAPAEPLPVNGEVEKLVEAIKKARVE